MNEFVKNKCILLTRLLSGTPFCFCSSISCNNIAAVDRAGLEFCCENIFCVLRCICLCTFTWKIPETCIYSWRTHSTVLPLKPLALSLQAFPRQLLWQKWVWLAKNINSKYHSWKSIHRTKTLHNTQNINIQAWK